MNKILLKYIDTAIHAEELAVRFYSNFSHRFPKGTPAQILLESAAKQKVLHKNYFTGLLAKARTGKFNIKESDVVFVKALDLEHFFQDIEIVGIHSQLSSLFRRAKGFQDILVEFYNSIVNIFTHEPEFSQIIAYNKTLRDELKKQIEADAARAS